MKIIDSVWEKENLGVTSKEIVIEINDDASEVSQVLNSFDEQYIVLKIPSGKSNIMRIADGLGYCFIEDIIEVEHDLHEVKRNKILQRLYDSLTYRLMETEDIDNLYNEISKGMFTNDRISNDPIFSIELSARRYKNWIKSLINEGALPYVMSYKEEPAGFIILTTKDKVTYYSVLGGGYEKFRNTGLGMVQKEQEIVKKLGGKRVTTNVSSNNVSQIKALLANGYTFSKIDHVYVKHNL